MGPSLDAAAERLRGVDVPDPLRERALTRAQLLAVSLSLVALDVLAAGVGALIADAGRASALPPVGVGVVVLAAAAYLWTTPEVVYRGGSVHRVDYVVIAAALALLVLVRVAAALVG